MIKGTYLKNRFSKLLNDIFIFHSKIHIFSSHKIPLTISVFIPKQIFAHEKEMFKILSPN